MLILVECLNILIIRLPFPFDFKIIKRISTDLKLRKYFPQVLHIAATLLHLSLLGQI